MILKKRWKRQFLWGEKWRRSTIIKKFKVLWMVLCINSTSRINRLEDQEACTRQRVRIASSRRKPRMKKNFTSSIFNLNTSCSTSLAVCLIAYMIYIIYFYLSAYFTLVILFVDRPFDDHSTLELVINTIIAYWIQQHQRIALWYRIHAI